MTSARFALTCVWLLCAGREVVTLRVEDASLAELPSEQSIAFSKKLVQFIETEGMWQSRKPPGKKLMNFNDVQDFLHHTMAELMDKYGERATFTRSGAVAGGTSIVVGDIHGRLHSLLPLLKKVHTDHGEGLTMLEGSNLFICDPNLHYVFLGDYVDRGVHSKEVVLLLLAYQTLCPTGITMLRGNHEDAETNDIYGFDVELHRVYGRSKAPTIRRTFNDLFAMLPHSTVIQEMAFANHGGLSEAIMNECGHGGAVLDTCMQWHRREQSIWSDPTRDDGFSFNVGRGAGDLYGNDVVEKFLALHDLTFMVRGHQWKEEGSAVQGSTYTIFSAADYYCESIQGADACESRRTEGEKNPLAYMVVQDTGAGFSHLTADEAIAMAKQMQPGLRLGGSILEIEADAAAGNSAGRGRGSASYCPPGALTDEEEKEFKAYVASKFGANPSAVIARELIDEAGEAIPEIAVAVEEVDDIGGGSPPEEFEVCKTRAQHKIIFETFGSSGGNMAEIEHLTRVAEEREDLLEEDATSHSD